MSLPNFPPGWFRLEPGDPVPPEERERYWWTPIARGIDRWLEPRWRALLTWVVLALLMRIALEDGRAMDRIHEAFGIVFYWIATSTGLPVLRGLSEIAFYANLFFLVSWYPPVVLRLGPLRIGAWIALSVALMSVVYFFSPGWSAVLFIFGHALGIPGLAAVKVRTRPWVSIIAGIFAAVSAGAIYHRDFQSSMWLAFLVPNTLYGAMMLYGTALIPKAPTR